MEAERPPLPPFLKPEDAARKVRLAEDAWNGRDPAKVALAYTPDSQWRNRSFHRNLGDAAGRQAETLTPADETFVRRHFDEERLHPGPLYCRRILHRVAEVVRHADVERLYGADFHCLGLREGW